MRGSSTSRMASPDQVPAHHEQHQGHTGEDHNVPVMLQAGDPVAGKAEHLAPVGVTDFRADAEEGKGGETSTTSPIAREASTRVGKIALGRM